MHPGGANTCIRVVYCAIANVRGFGVFDGYWAGLESIELGPDVCGLCCWVALLCDGVSQGCFASTAED